MPAPSLSLLATLLIAGIAFQAAAQDPASADAPGPYCQRVGTDDTLRKIPPGLVPEVNALFGFHMPEQVAIDTTNFRCADGHVMVCSVGANLPCGKANASRNLPGTRDWCRQNPDAGFIPMYITGHDTIYQWRCRNGAPAIERQIYTVDPRGFIAKYWKRLN